MKNYEMSREEKEYLSHYDISAFERPSIATDIVIFSILDDGISDNIRKLPKKALKVLLIKRANYPYKDCWALPGGFARLEEDITETARRELYEETNVKDAYLQPVGIYGRKNRDPRGWIVSNAFMALMDGEKCSLRAGTDAWEAQWFVIDIQAQELKRELKEDGIFIETKYQLSLTNEENGGIAFDHGEIILSALLSLRSNVEKNLQPAFDLLPEMFTLTQLQNVFEILLGRDLLAANFRRKIADYVVETEKIAEGAGHRPAKYFKRNVEAFYRN